MPFLDAGSPLYLGTTVRFLHDRTLLDGFAHLTDAVRRGGTAITQHDALEPDHPMWVEFARAMAPLAGASRRRSSRSGSPPSRSARPRVLDVAAGHGLFGIALAKRNPALEVTALDWPNVLAGRTRERREGGRRRSACARDRATRSPPTSAPSTTSCSCRTCSITSTSKPCEVLLRRVHAAFEARRPGRASSSSCPTRIGSGPATAVMFGLVMLAMTPEGDVYTLSECSRMLERAGFRKTTLHALTPSPQQVVIAERSQ